MQSLPKMPRFSTENGTLVFASINLMVAVGSSIFAFGLLALMLFSDGDILDRSVWGALSRAYLLAGTVFLFMFSLITLLFSSFLLHGILKKKSEYLKVYLIFGVMQLIVAPFSIVMVLRLLVIPLNPCVYNSFVCLYVVYSPILCMVRRTYLQYKKDKQFDYQQTLEKY